MLQGTEVLSGRVLQSFKVESVAVIFSHPQNENLCLVCPLTDVPALLDLQSGQKMKLSEPKDDESSGFVSALFSFFCLPTTTSSPIPLSLEFDSSLCHF